MAQTVDGVAPVVAAAWFKRLKKAIESEDIFALRFTGMSSTDWIVRLNMDRKLAGLLPEIEAVAETFGAICIWFANGLEFWAEDNDPKIIVGLLSGWIDRGCDVENFIRPGVRVCRRKTEIPNITYLT